VLIQAWLQKQRQMIEALMRRIAAGAHHPRPYKPREIKPGAVARPRPETPPEKRLPPRVFGWINHMASEIGPWAAAMNYFIGVPEMKAMVLASPQLARLWLPLLNAVGAEKPDWWPKPPPRPRRARKARPRSSVVVPAGRDAAVAPLPANPEPQPQMGTWFPPQPPPPPPRRITSWRDFVDSMRPVSQNFEPPPSDWVIVRPTPGKPDF
jgi:hypothetical protein